MKQWRMIMRESLLEVIKLAHGDPNAVAYPLAGVLTIEGPEDRAIEPVLDMSGEVPNLAHTIVGYGSYEQAVASLDALLLLMDIAGLDYNPWRYLEQGVRLPSLPVLHSFIDYDHETIPANWADRMPGEEFLDLIPQGVTRMMTPADMDALRDFASFLIHDEEE